MLSDEVIEHVAKVVSYIVCVGLPGRRSCNHKGVLCAPGLCSSNKTIGCLHASPSWQLGLTWYGKAALGGCGDDSSGLRSWLQTLQSRIGHFVTCGPV